VRAVTSHSRLFDSHEKDFGYVEISVNPAVSSGSFGYHQILLRSCVIKYIDLFFYSDDLYSVLSVHAKFNNQPKFKVIVIAERSEGKQTLFYSPFIMLASLNMTTLLYFFWHLVDNV